MWLRKLFAGLSPQRVRPPRPASSGTHPRKAQTQKPGLETLEDRLVPARLYVGDIMVVEGNTGSQMAEVPVTLSAPRGNRVSVNYQTIAGSAEAGTDYEPESGRLVFAPGQTEKTILVPIKGDRLHESDEYFLVKLSNPKGAKMGDNQGYISIVDNEPRFNIYNSSQYEGQSGSTFITFSVNLLYSYDQEVKVDFSTSDGSALLGDNDYLATSGTLTFAPGVTTQTFTVEILGDSAVEPEEYMNVTLSNASSNAQIPNGQAVGSILDDDGWYDPGWYDPGWYDYGYYGWYDYGYYGYY